MGGLRGQVREPQANARARRNSQGLASSLQFISASEVIGMTGGGYFTLTLATASGLVNTSGELLIDLDTNPGLVLAAGGIKVLTPASSGLTLGATGILIDLDTNPGLVLGVGGIKILLPGSSGLTLGATGLLIDPDGSTLTLGASGVKVTAPEGWWTITAIKTSAHTADVRECVRCDPSGGAFTVTLPTASGIAGRQIIVKNVTTSTNTITVDGDGAETIDGDVTVEMTIGWASLTLISDGTNWLIV